MHARVIRPYSHSLSDDERLYKTPAEREAEARRDPIARFADFLRTSGLASDADLAALAAEVEREVSEAAIEALKAPRPAASTAAAYVYSPDVDPSSSAFETPAAPEGKPDTMVAAINRTLKDEMARNAPVGEAIATLFAYEGQVPAIAWEKIRGLREFYGLRPGQFEFFSVHLVSDLAHAGAEMDAIAQSASSEDAVVDAVSRSCDLLLGFLDGCYATANATA